MALGTSSAGRKEAGAVQLRAEDAECWKAAAGSPRAS